MGVLQHPRMYMRGFERHQNHMTQPNAILEFTYSARTPDGHSLSGTIDASNSTEARQKLESLHLFVSEIAPAGRPRARAMAGEDFITFNQQLAQLAAAGLPLEQGLGLVAQELRRGQLKRTIEQIADDLQKGRTLAQAVESRKQQFPPLFARLVDAGTRAGNLSSVLLNLGRHMAMVRSLQAALVRTLTYPLIVLLTFMAVMAFVFLGVIPQFHQIYADFHMELPFITQLLLGVSDLLYNNIWIFAGLMALILILIGMFVVSIGRGSPLGQAILRYLPPFAGVLKKSLIARWCDAVAVGIEAGMDLPDSIALADDTIESPAIRRDGEAMAQAISAGQPLASIPPGKILPVTIAAAIDLASQRNDLAPSLRTLGQMYRQQAEVRVAAIPAILSPLLLILMGFLIGIVITAMIAPIISLISSISSPMSFHRH